MLVWMWLAAASADDLVVRVSDAVARPGERAAVVLRTYETVPIEQGQICFRAGSGPQRLPDDAMVVDLIGDSLVQWSLAANGDVLLQFRSPSGGINAVEGPMVVLWYDVPATTVAGQAVPLELDPASFVLTASGALRDIEPREGVVQIVDRQSPYRVYADGDQVRPGQWAEVGVETAEPLELASGHIVFEYDPAIVRGTPLVDVPAFGSSAAWSADVSTPGEIVVDFTATDAGLNVVPGTLVRVGLQTRPGVPLGTVSAVRIRSSSLDSTRWGAVPIQAIDDRVRFRP